MKKIIIIESCIIIGLLVLTGNFIHAAIHFLLTVYLLHKVNMNIIS